MPEAVNEKLILIFKESFPASESKINLETKTIDIVEWDSMAHILLIQKIEAAFDIEFEIDELLEFDSFMNISTVVHNKLNA